MRKNHRILRYLALHRRPSERCRCSIKVRQDVIFVMDGTHENG